MLTTLRIKNLALVADLTLDLQPGYNVITGETGAGKSILIGALNLLLGQRADRTLIREGSDSCIVEAIFDTRARQAPLNALLEQHGLEPGEDHQLILKRSLSQSGANRQFVNGSPATLNSLAAIGEELVDIHGPHEHQSLLHPSRQLAILDAFGGLQPARKALDEWVRQRAALETEKAALVTDEKTCAQQLDLLRFQVGEIDAAALQPGEDQCVEEHYRRAGNAARLMELSRAVLDVLGENDSAVLIQFGVIGRTLQELQRLDPAATPMLDAHQQGLDLLKDLQSQVSRYLDKLDVDPERLRQLEERLNLIHSLRRKYGASQAEIAAFGEEARRKLRALEQRDTELVRLNRQLREVETELRQAGEQLAARRRKVIPELARAVNRELAGLGFKQSRFDASLESEFQISKFKFELEFQFAPNPGEPARPLRAIASSGELARVMLGLKTVLAAEDEIPVLVFDEVDANVGGETANVIGAKMRQIASRRQVLCITHLPQVAAPAAHHYVVTKRAQSGRTISEIQRLDAAARIEELTRMLGGRSETARKHAEAMLRA